MFRHFNVDSKLKVSATFIVTLLFSIKDLSVDNYFFPLDLRLYEALSLPISCIFKLEEQRILMSAF